MGDVLTDLFLFCKTDLARATATGVLMVMMSCYVYTEHIGQSVLKYRHI